MACGLAVVGADVGGQRELVDETCGILLKPSGDLQKDAAAYAQILERLINDDEERNRLGVFARSQVEGSFDQEKMIARFLLLIDKVSQNRSTPGATSDCELVMAMAKRKAQAYSTRNRTSVELLNRYWKPSIRALIYYWLRARLSTIYNFGKRGGWKWMIKTKEMLVNLLIPGIFEES